MKTNVDEKIFNTTGGSWVTLIERKYNTALRVHPQKSKKHGSEALELHTTNQSPNKNKKIWRIVVPYSATNLTLR